MKTYKQYINEADNRKSAQSMMSTQHKNKANKDIMKKSLDASTASIKALGNITVGISWEYMTYLQDTKDFNNMRYVNEYVIKTAQNENKKLKVISKNDDGTWTVKTKKYDLNIPSQFLVTK